MFYSQRFQERSKSPWYTSNEYKALSNMICDMHWFLHGDLSKYQSTYYLDKDSHIGAPDWSRSRIPSFSLIVYPQ